MCQLLSKAIQRIGILNSWIWLANRVLETGPVLYSPDRSPDVFPGHSSQSVKKWNRQKRIKSYLPGYISPYGENCPLRL